MVVAPILNTFRQIRQFGCAQMSYRQLNTNLFSRNTVWYLVWNTIINMNYYRHVSIILGRKKNYSKLNFTSTYNWCANLLK